MATHDQDSYGAPRVSEGGNEYDISLRPLFQALWFYRRVMALFGCVIVVLFVLWGLWTYVTQPVERQASVEFRLLFEGASNNEYPNGLRFSHSEIVAGTILPEVYAANALERYLSIDDFKRRAVVLGTNNEVELLRLEYQARLAGTGITQVERVALEQDFDDRREGLRSAHYRLSFLSPGGSVPIPDELMRKTLSDILEEWATQAVLRKGALFFQVSPLDASVLRGEFLAANEHFVKADILRGQIDNVLNNLTTLGELPGVSKFQSLGGTVKAAQLNLEGLIRYRLEPLTARLWSDGMFFDADAVERYVQNRLFQVELALDEARGLGGMLQESLRYYVADNPGRPGLPEFGANADGRASEGSTAQNPGTFQIGDQFLERIIALAGASIDEEFRQDLTDRIIEAGEAVIALERELAYYQRVSGLSRQTRSPAPEALEAAAMELDTVLATADEAIGQVGSLYDELSMQNLSPQSSLVEITSPFAVTFLRAITVQTLALYGLFTLLVAFLVVPLLCLSHSYFRREIRRSH